MQHGEHLCVCSWAATLITMMMLIIIITAGDPFSDHNVNNITNDSLVAFDFSVLEASPFTIGRSDPVCSADPHV